MVDFMHDFRPLFFHFTIVERVEVSEFANRISLHNDEEVIFAHPNQMDVYIEWSQFERLTVELIFSFFL